MSFEIGSEYWLPMQVRHHSGSAEAFLKKFKSFVFLSSGRSAMALCLQKLHDQVKSKSVLLPGYLCESVITPFASMGYDCHFYDISRDLNPVLEPFCSNHLEIGVFVHNGYFGFPTNENLDKIILNFRRNGTVVIEDITHSFFYRCENLNSSDYYVASLRKWLGLPSGGFLASNIHSVPLLEDNKVPDYCKLREDALFLKGKYVNNNYEGDKKEFLQKFRSAEELLDKDIWPYSMDNLSKDLFMSLDIEAFAKQRVDNFVFLHENMPQNYSFSPVFKCLPANVTPLFFPVYADGHRNGLQKFLAGENIYCPVHWPVPASECFTTLPLSSLVYANILSIPCDQRYDLSDMEEICRVVAKYNFANN